jgi:phage gp36-like protein
MSWRTLTESDLNATLSAQEVEAFRRSADWASDPVEALLTRTAEYVRGYLRQSGVAMSPTAATIPEGLVSPACDYAAYDVLKRMPRDVARDRADARRAAVELFEAVAKGNYKVEPYGSDDDSGGGASPSFVVPDHILD